MDGAEGERVAGRALLRRARGFEEVGFAILLADYLRMTVGIDEDSDALIDADGADGFGLAGGENARHEDEQAAFAMAGVEVRVRDDAAEDGNAEEVRGYNDLAGEGIGEGCVG